MNSVSDFAQASRRPCVAKSILPGDPDARQVIGNSAQAVAWQLFSRVGSAWGHDHD